MNTFVTPSLAVNTMLPRKRILYVEDNPGDARLFQEVLERYGAGEFHIEHETSLAGGLQKLSEDRIDIVLLDLGLPESLGMATLFRVLLKHPKVPVVVLTGLKDESTALQALRWGAQDYVVKGNILKGDVLLRILRYSMARHRYWAQKR